MNILSLFDGISCGQQALKELKIPVEKYYASEIDKYAISITQKHFSNTIQLGDINNWRAWDIDWQDIDLVMGGSPCQGFSFAGKQLNFDDPRSKLFFRFVEILKRVNDYRHATNKDDVKFLLENVRMKQEYQDVISEQLGVKPVMINSALVSAQNRIRLYWTNLGKIEQPENKGIVLKDILDTNLDPKFNLKVSDEIKPSVRKNVVKQYNKIINSEKDIQQLDCDSGWQDNKVGINKSPTIRASNPFILGKTKTDLVRKLTPLECERLQTLPDNYTAKGIMNGKEVKISNTQRYKALGNGWTVEVIKHILKYMQKTANMV